MDNFGYVLTSLAGLFAVGSGLWEVRILRRMRRFWARSDGVVLRHKIIGYDRTMPMYCAVIGFSDEHGDRHEFMNDLTFERPLPESGVAVRVLYQRGRPEIARLDRASFRVASLAIRFVVGAVFLVGAIPSMFGALRA